jgi:hypothetical protein
MEKLVVLDFTTNTVHVHPLEREDFIDDEYIENIGYDSSNCHWMAGEIEVIQHKGILK